MADDGGVLAACLMAASVALTAANIACFDILLASNILILNNKEEFILDPTLSQISKAGNNGTLLTIAIVPSLEKVIFYNIGLSEKDDLQKKLFFQQISEKIGFCSLISF